MEGVIEKVKESIVTFIAYGRKTKTWQAFRQQVARLFVLLEKHLDKQIDKQSKSKPCQRTIVCECYRRSCPYRPVAVRTYIRKLKEA